MPAPIWINIPLRYVNRARRLLGRQSRTSRTLPLGPYTDAFRRHYWDYNRSVGHSQYPGRHTWSRVKIPLYGTAGLSIPVAPVLVPGNIRFAWENPNELPAYTPQFSFRPPRNTQRYIQAGIQPPPYEMVVRVSRAGGPGRPPPEINRRRKDAKIHWGINRIYTLLNRYYGPYTEWAEAAALFEANFHDPGALTTALAVNAAVERSFGARARLLKKHVYSQDFYNLPVGYDTISRLWR